MTEAAENMVNTVCPLCGANRFIELSMFRGGEWQLLKCDACSMVRTFPEADLQRMEQVNVSNYGRPYLQRRTSNSSKLMRSHKTVLEKLAMMKQPSISSILDVGCGAGLFLDSATKKGWTVKGIDINHDNAVLCQSKGHDVKNTRLVDGVFDYKTFDVISYWDVLEHVKDPVADLRLSLRLLKEGGILFIQCPNIDSELAQLWQERWPWLCLPDHLHHFSPNTLQEMVERAGFSVLDISTFEEGLDLFRAKLHSNGGVVGLQKYCRALYLWPYLFRYYFPFNDDRRRGLIRLFAKRA